MRIVPGVVGAVVLVLAASAARAERPRIAVKPLAGATATAAVRERMTHSMSEGLAASGATIVTAASPTPSNGDYVFRGSLEVAGRTYDWRIELLDGTSGTLLQFRTDRCEICTEDEALEMAGVSASTLKAQVFNGKEAPTQARLDLARAAPTPDVGLASPAPEPSRGHRPLGWVGIGAGVVAAAAGVYLLSIDGQGTCPGMVQCKQVRDTKVGGWASIAGGAVALTVGVLVLTGTF